jgi:carbamoyl-phosphate synthase large subunit
LSPLTIAVTGLNATDNPGPGVPVIRSIRHGADREIRIIGLAYNPLDPGNYMDGIADRVFLMPYPSQGAPVVLERLEEICSLESIDILIPNLDAELPALLKLENSLVSLGIRTFLPSERSLKMRSKARLQELNSEHGIRTPKSVAIGASNEIQTLDREFDFPVYVKGQFYDAEIAHSPMEVERHFQSLRAKWGVPVIVQEFVSGEEYDVVAVGDGKGGLVGAVPMRKMQLTDKGKAWGGITISDPDLFAFVERIIQKLEWRGPCELEVMKTRESGDYYLLEINPRFPAWVYLTAGADRNLPWATVRLSLGEEVTPMAPPKPGVMFLRHSFDQICDLEQYESLTIKGDLSH